MRELDVHFKVRGRAVRINDFVRVASTPGKRDGFVGRVKSVECDGEGRPLYVTVVGASGKKAPAWRTIEAARLSTITADTQAKLQQEHAEMAERLNLGPRPRRGRR